MGFKDMSKKPVTKSQAKKKKEKLARFKEFAKKQAVKKGIELPQKEEE